MGWSKNWSNPWQIWPSDVAEFMGAANERCLLLGTTALFDPVVAAGDVVQTFAYERDGTTKGWLRKIQEWIWEELPHFAVSHEGGVKRNVEFWDGADDEAVMTYGDLDPADRWAAVLSAAGLASMAFWPRFTDRDSETTGFISACDILHYKTLYYVQAILNVLVWAEGSAAWDSKNENSLKQSDSGAWYSSLSDAQNASESNWGTTSDGGGNGPEEYTSVSTYVIPPDPAYYWAYQAKRYAYGKFANPSTAMNKDVEVYAVPLAVGANWDDYGQGIDGYQGKYMLLHATSLSPGAAGDHWTPQVGEIGGAGSWPGDEGQWAGANEGRGWRMEAAPRVLFLGDVAGGLEYL